jgi:hypothetical protein
MAARVVALHQLDSRVSVRLVCFLSFGASVVALHPLQSSAFSKHWQESVAHRKVAATAEGAIPPGNAQAKGLAVLYLALESSADALTEG